MSSVKVAQAPVATQPAPPAAPTVDAEHLRRIVEKQPACLMRVGTDGLILAANDAALGLLGAQQPADVLGGLLTKWIVPAHHGAWREFSRTVSAGISQSVECDLTDVSGTPRSVVFHGVPLVDHADGIASLILGARDVSALRRLEIALQDSDAIRQKLAGEPTPHPIENVSGKLKELEAKLEEAEADRDRLERALSRLPQLEQLLKQGRTHLQDLRTRLDEATAERNRLAAQLGQREVANEELWTEQADLQQALTEKQQSELDELRTRLQDANATRDAVAARLHARETEHEHLLAEQQELRCRLDEAVSEKDQLVTQLSDLESSHQQLLDDQRAHLGHLRTQFEEAAADRDRFSEQLQDAETYCQQLLNDHNTERTHHDEERAGHQVERARLEEAAGAAVAQQKASEKALADQRVELESMDLATRRIEPLAAAGRLALDVARELVTAVADIDARAACLVAECPADSSSREEVEQLRADAVRAASLARQILQASHINHPEERK